MPSHGAVLSHNPVTHTSQYHLLSPQDGKKNSTVRTPWEMSHTQILLKVLSSVCHLAWKESSILGEKSQPVLENHVIVNKR